MTTCWTRRMPMPKTVCDLEEDIENANEESKESVETREERK